MAWLQKFQVIVKTTLPEPVEGLALDKELRHTFYGGAKPTARSRGAVELEHLGAFSLETEISGFLHGGPMGFDDFFPLGGAFG